MKSPAEIADEWFDEFAASMVDEDYERTVGLFADDSWWRDLLALTWDIRTYRGREQILAFLREFGPDASLADIRRDPAHVPAATTVLGHDVVDAFFTFRTGIAVGRGIVRLLEENGRWRAWTISTRMDDLVGLEEVGTTIGDSAAAEHNEARRGRRTWEERRADESEFRDEDPTVLVVGAGHSGLIMGARLRKLGVTHLVVDREERLGDNWRLRYAGLTLHETSWRSQFPYLAYPDNWPIYTPAELLADWLEAYARFLQVNVWTRTDVTQATYDPSTARWTVHMTRAGATRTLYPRHLVFATGMNKPPRVPDVPGAERFRGERLHSEHFPGGRRFEGARAVVVGTGSSGQDVAQSLYEGGAAEVTLVQRGGTYVMSGASGMPVFMGMWTECHPPIEEANLIAMSTPYGLVREAFGPAMTEEISRRDRTMIEGLENAGFELYFGENNVGIADISISRGGGYYIDKGNAQLIIDGSILLKRGEIAEFTEDGVIYSDGTHSEADVVVFATGYSSPRESLRDILGDEVTDQLPAMFSGLDEFGELRGTFRRSGHPALWLVWGSIHLVRVYSKLTALQILGDEAGVAPRDDRIHRLT